VTTLHTLDPNGRTVVLSSSRWEHIIDRGAGHPEMTGLQAEVLEAVRAPDRRQLGHEPNENWFYRAGVGPSQWIKVVVIYEAGRGSIITAFPRRTYP
jgi:hypothetical protein